MSDGELNDKQLNDKPGLSIEPLTDVAILGSLLQRRWGETLMMFGRIWKPDEYLALVAYNANREILGVVTYATQKSMMLALTLDNFSPLRGVGYALLLGVMAIARKQGARTLRVVTTNDNTPALRYFQKLGFRIVAFYPDAVSIYRTIAPDLPKIGVDSIPVRDSIELEMDL